MSWAGDLLWTSSRAGERCSLVTEAEFIEVRTELLKVIQGHFSMRRGYLVLRQAVEGPIPGVSLAITRGEFRAQLEIRCTLQQGHDESGLYRLQILSDATTERILEHDLWQARFLRAIQVSRLSMAIACAIGVVSFLTLANATMAMAILLAAGAGACGCANHLADRMVLEQRGRVLAMTAGDPNVQTDLRRWRALQRLVGRRQGRRADATRTQPFRRLAPSTYET